MNDSATPLSKEFDVRLLQSMIVGLWKLLDNIDSFDDMTLDDSGYREMARAQSKDRFDILTTDGYSLFLPVRQEMDDEKIHALRELLASEYAQSIDLYIRSKDGSLTVIKGEFPHIRCDVNVKSEDHVLEDLPGEYREIYAETEIAFIFQPGKVTIDRL